MSTFVFADSPYRYTDPVRLYKANDPYYFEVDNIPIRQLEENCQWLKDQLQKNVLEIQLADVKRSEIAELKPYANGGDRLVRVKPGRFSARINDIANKEPLQYLNNMLGEKIGEMDVWQAHTINPNNAAGALLETVLNKFKTYIAENATHMNGLAERAFTWPVMSEDIQSPYVNGTSNPLSYTNTDGAGKIGPTLISQALLWAKSANNQESFYLLPTYDYTDNSIGFGRLPVIENHFVKKWRGVARTAIVDVSEELTIEVPPFDPTDFFYTNENNEKVVIEGVQNRIDLVFIYSKPVDASGVSVFKNGTIQSITAPALGIIRGAGIGQSFKALNSITNEYGPVSVFDEYGNVQMLPNPSDQLDSNVGFNSTLPVIRGSFPSPDDILNIAPLLSERLENDSLELIGQSILPVAYVFVRANADKNVANADILLDTDIIDIRPFFRTAELTYNERAGLAAAMPQLSLANPAVGQAQLDYSIKRVKEYADNLIASQTKERATDVVAGGFIFGGWFFGPEAALYGWHLNSFKDNNDPVADTKNFVRKSYFGVNPSYNLDIPDYPDWDISKWALPMNSAGTFPNDYLTPWIGNDNDVHLNAGSFKEQTLPGMLTPQGQTPERLSKISGMAMNAWQAYGNGLPGIGTNAASWLHGTYISKTIYFDRSKYGWMLDYIVDINFVNCIPATSQGTDGGYAAGGAGISGWWLEKGQNYFTIYVAFTPPFAEAKTAIDFPAPQEIGGIKTHHRSSNKFAATLVCVKDMMEFQETPAVVANQYGRPGYSYNPKMGLCTYPTISWRMYGIPDGDKDYYYTNLNSKNPTITLK